jgi:hypothetical protein
MGDYVFGRIAFFSGFVSDALYEVIYFFTDLSRTLCNKHLQDI